MLTLDRDRYTCHTSTPKVDAAVRRQCDDIEVPTLDRYICHTSTSKVDAAVRRDDDDLMATALDRYICHTSTPKSMPRFGASDEMELQPMCDAARTCGDEIDGVCDDV